MCGAFASVPTTLQYEQFRGGRYLSIAGFKESDCKCLTIYRDSIPPLAYEARVEAEPFCMCRNHSRFQDLEGQDERTSERRNKSPRDTPRCTLLCSHHRAHRYILSFCTQLSCSMTNIILLAYLSVCSVWAKILFHTPVYGPPPPPILCLPKYSHE